MTDGNGKFYALKCFTRELPGRDERYALICDELHYLQSGYFIEMKYFCNELFVSSDISDEELFPLLLMDWVEGVPLDLYLRNCIDRGGDRCSCLALLPLWAFCFLVDCSAFCAWRPETR